MKYTPLSTVLTTHNQKLILELQKIELAITTLGGVYKLDSTINLDISNAKVDQVKIS